MTTAAPAKSIATYARDFESSVSKNRGPEWLNQLRKDAVGRVPETGLSDRPSR